MIKKYYEKRPEFIEIWMKDCEDPQQLNKLLIQNHV